MTDIEPWLERTLFLLNSKAEDSTEQLRLMLEESIRNKYGHKKMFLRPIPGPSSPSQKKDDAALLNSKKRKIEGKTKFVSSPKESTSSSQSSGSNESDFTLEVEEVSCAVCRGLSVVPHNRLVECADCHLLYHQECHSPPIEDLDVNDPRGVWYCANCSKNIAGPKISSTGSSPFSSKSSSFQAKSGNISQRSTGHSTFSSKPFGGLSVPAKKSSGSSSSNSSKSSSSSSSKSVSPNMNIINADKRLQIMKKKAAKKQEKRINSK